MSKTSTVIGIILGVIIILGLQALVTMLLWNEVLVSTIVGINEIGYWQAFGILILANILFKPAAQFKK